MLEHAVSRPLAPHSLWKHDPPSGPSTSTSLLPTLYLHVICPRADRLKSVVTCSVSVSAFCVSATSWTLYMPTDAFKPNPPPWRPAPVALRVSTMSSLAYTVWLRSKCAPALKPLQFTFAQLLSTCEAYNPLPVTQQYF